MSDSFEKFCSGEPESEAVRSAVNFAKATGMYSDGSELDPVYRKWRELMLKENPNYKPFMPPNHWNYEQQAREAFDRHREEVLRASIEAGNKLDEEQLFRAFCEALAAGDFVKQVVAGTGAQNFIYVPFNEVERLRVQLAEKREALKLAFEILEKDFDYRPDDDDRWDIIRKAL